MQIIECTCDTDDGRHHSNYCDTNTKRMVLVTLVDQDNLGIEHNGHVVAMYDIENDWREALEVAKALANINGLKWDVTLEARNELRMF